MPALRHAFGSAQIAWAPDVCDSTGKDLVVCFVREEQGGYQPPVPVKANYFFGSSADGRPAFFCVSFTLESEP